MHTILVSSSLGYNFNLPISKKHKDNVYFEDKLIPAYALNYELSFVSEEDYKNWSTQYKDYIEGSNAVLRIGKSSGHTLEKINDDVEKKTNKKRQSDVNSIADKDNSNGIEVEVEKA